MTHINAYYEEVALAEQEVEKAKAKLEAAKRDLHNHPDYEAPKKKPESKPKDSKKAKDKKVKSTRRK